MKRPLIVIALAALVAAACGDDTPAQTTAPSDTTDPTETTAAPTTTSPETTTTTEAAAFELDALTDLQRTWYLFMCEQAADPDSPREWGFTFDLIQAGEVRVFDPSQDQSGFDNVVPQALVDDVLAIDLGTADEGFGDAMRDAILPHCP